MENEITQKSQETVIPQEKIKPNKKILLPIIVGMIFVLIISFIFYQQKQITKITELKPISTTIPKPSKITASNPEELINEIKENIVTLCPKAKLDENKTDQKKHGVFWINENKKISLFKENGIYFQDIFNNTQDSDQTIINKECFNKILNIIKNNFIVNESNTTNNNYIQGFEKENIKLLVISGFYYKIIFGEIINENEMNDNQKLLIELYPFVNSKYNPDILLEVENKINNFAHITIFNYGPFGSHSIWKKEGEKWRNLLSTQDNWECEIVINEKIPHDLVDNRCYYYKTQEEWKYNTGLNKWEKQ